MLVAQFGMQDLRRWSAVVILGIYAAVEGHGATLAGGWLSACLAFFALALGVALVGVHQRQMWARWLALGAGVTGLSNVLILLAEHGPARLDAGTLAFASMPLGLLLTLGGRRMAQHFADALPSRSVWRRLGDPRLTLAATAIVMSVAATAMLLMFSAVAWHDEATFIAIAGVLGVGAALTAREHAAGLIFMGAGAFASAGVAIDLAELAHATHRCGMSWRLGGMALIGYPSIALGAVAGIAALLAFSGPMVRFVRAQRGG